MFQTEERSLLDVNVSTQITRPIIMVKSPQRAVIYPLSFNHPLVIGMIIAGTEIKKVRKIKTALPIAATYSVSSEETFPQGD